MAFLVKRLEDDSPAVYITREDLHAMQVARAERLWADGLDKRKICAAIGITFGQLNAWTQRHRDRFPPRKGGISQSLRASHEAKIAAAADLARGGMTRKQIAAHLGVSHNTVVSWALRYPQIFPALGRVRGAAEFELLEREERRPGQALSPPAPARPAYQPGIEALFDAGGDNGGKPVPLAETTAMSCKYEVSGRDHDFLFCGQRVKPGTSWCPAHHGLVYQKRGV